MTNPPGSTSEQLPDDVLELLPHTTYLSTACETADLLSRVIRQFPERKDLLAHQKKLHGRCRLNHKFTGTLCFCRCHATEREEDGHPNPQEAGLGTD